MRNVSLPPDPAAHFIRVDPPPPGEGKVSAPLRRAVRPEQELAVALEKRPRGHVKLSVLTDEEPRALRHFLGALQQQARIVGAHLVGKRLAFLVVAVTHVRLQLPRRRRSRLPKCRRRQRAQRACHQKALGPKSRHHPPSHPPPLKPSSS